MPHRPVTMLPRRLSFCPPDALPRLRRSAHGWQKIQRLLPVLRLAQMLVLWPLACPVARAGDTIFVYTDSGGVPHFSDRADDPRYRPYLTDASAPVRNLQAHAPAQRLGNITPRYREEITRAARANQLDAALLHAIITVESGYNARAISPRGALGLMQLMPQTARQYHVDNPLDAGQNIAGGSRLLRNLLDQYNNNLDLTLAAYNAGSGRVEQYGHSIPPFSETVQFVPTVLAHYARYQRDRSLTAP